MNVRCCRRQVLEGVKQSAGELHKNSSGAAFTLRWKIFRLFLGLSEFWWEKFGRTSEWPKHGNISQRQLNAFLRLDQKLHVWIVFFGLEQQIASRNAFPQSTLTLIPTAAPERAPPDTQISQERKQ